MLVFDTETYKSGKFRLAVVYDGKNYYRFITEYHLIEHLLNSEHEKIFAHNLSYDIVGIINQKKTAKFIMSSGRVIAVQINKKKVFIDSFNYFPMSLDKAAKNFLNDKKTLQKENYNDIFKMSDKECFELCEKDCDLLYRCLKTFFTLMKKQYNDKSKFKIKYTLPSFSLHIFQNNFLDYENTTRTCNKEFFRKAYYGGRTEVFSLKKHTGKIYYYDVNSMYPAVMRYNYPLPATILENTNNNKKREFINIYDGISEVVIKAPDNLKIPFLPKKIDKAIPEKNLKKGNLIFPLGEFEGCYTHVELRKAKKIGYKILEVKQQYIALKSAKVFKNFVEKYYKLKQTSKAELRTFYKLILNSLYGKFGASDEMVSLYTGDDIENFSEKDFDCTINYSTDNYIAILKKTTQEQKYNNIIWACYVTGYARILLYEYMEKVNYNVIYCDTDSLITEYKMPDIVISQDKLGLLKLEHELKFFEAKAPKMYKMVDKNCDIPEYKAKGVSKEKQPEFYEKGKATTIKPVKILEYFTSKKANNEYQKKIKQGKKANKPKTEYKFINNWIEKEKRIISIYNKRIINPDLSTTPHIL